MGILDAILDPTRGDSVQRTETELYKKAGDTLLDDNATLFEKGSAMFKAIAYDVMTVSEEERREMERQEKLAKQEAERKELLEEERQRQLAIRDNGNSPELNRNIQLNQDPESQAHFDLEDRERYEEIKAVAAQVNQLENPERPSAIAGAMRSSSIAQLKDLKANIEHGNAPQVGDGMEAVSSQELDAMQSIDGMIAELEADRSQAAMVAGTSNAGPEELAQLNLGDPDSDSPDVSGAGGLFGSQEQEFEAQLNQGQTVTIDSGTEVALTGTTIHDLTGAPPSTSGSFFVSKETTVTLNRDDGTLEFPDDASVTFEGKVDFPDGRSAGWRENVNPKEKVFTLVS